MDGRAAQLEQTGKQAFHLVARSRLDAETKARRVGVGATDVEVLYFKTAVELNDGVEDLLHDVGVDEMAFCFDDFLQRGLGGLHGLGCEILCGSEWGRDGEERSRPGDDLKFLRGEIAFFQCSARRGR
jgi:hypothetical protein